MSDFKIGGSAFRPASGISNVKKGESKAPEQAKATETGAHYDTASVNRRAVMPRMSSTMGNSAESVRSEAVESMLRDTAAELDDYFTGAYGFKK